MTYYYEALNAISFQRLAQSLILVKHPDALCLPVPQPDGGRDALLYVNQSEKSEFIIFQVKFTVDPKSKSEREAVQQVIDTEGKKVKQLIERGATHFYLITNVSGTAHLDKGSIDKTNKALTEAFDIPSFVWWRDDLDAQLNNAADVKWSFTEILRASDILQLLVQRPGFDGGTETARTIAAYIGKQYGADRDVKFKQVELKKRIIDLFVDLPIDLKGDMEFSFHDLNRSTWHPHADYLDQLSIDIALIDEDEYPFLHGGLAAAFFQLLPFEKGVSRFVLEGAPGQGKSTVTQFLCQINRLKLLPNRRSELGVAASTFQDSPTRTPFRVDLRDFAAWLSGRDPFHSLGGGTLPATTYRSLENFLTMQVKNYAGGLQITQHDLVDFLSRTHSLLVLDGFDEVADAETRKRVVEEICAAADRLDTQSLSLQIIVTSRPAAFANSPGFPDDQWAHLELGDLKRDNIAAYREKWSDVQELTPAEREALETTLKEKLTQPHLRDLARNPMQLTILLQLMHIQGAALPDKRTALYDEYMKIFLNREVEKKQLAADHRDLLLALHGALAWLLQLQAETGEGSGSISLSNLRREIREYLEEEGYEPSLSDTLMKGTVERVGALVSRVQGTYEFEVQPLREYFAARHLHKTAPYSPPGKPRRGTRPERFLALACSSYWTNVTRFYCGFYDKGELASLVDGLIELGEREGYAIINQPRRLALMLLSDHVFSESPRTVRRLIDFVGQDQAFLRLLHSERTVLFRGLQLPESSGGRELVSTCKAKLEQCSDPTLRKEFRLVIAANTSVSQRKELFLERIQKGKVGAEVLGEALDFRVVRFFSDDEPKRLFPNDSALRVRWLVAADRYEQIIELPQLYGIAREMFFNCTLRFSNRGPGRRNSATSLEILTELLSPSVLQQFFHAPSDVSATQIIARHSAWGQRSLHEYIATTPAFDEKDEVTSYASVVSRLMAKTPLVEWQVSLAPWNEVVDEGLAVHERGFLFSLMAVMSTAVSLRNEIYMSSGAADEIDAGPDDGRAREKRAEPVGYWDRDGFEPTPGLVNRLYYARQRADDSEWWLSHVGQCQEHSLLTFITMCCSWASERTLTTMIIELSEEVDRLREDEWRMLIRIVESCTIARGSQAGALTAHWFKETDIESLRLAFLLSFRVEQTEDRVRVGRHYFYDYGGSDYNIVGRAAEWETESKDADKVDWEYLLRLSRLSRKHNIRFLFGSGRVPSIDVPKAVAEDVLKNCENHAGQMIEICEKSMGLYVAQTAPTLSEVSAQDAWFVVD